MVDLDKIIGQAIEKDASDIHLILQSKPMYRIGKSLVKMQGAEVLNDEDMYQIYDYFTKGNVARDKALNENKNLDISYDYNGINLGINLSFANKTPVYTMKIWKNELPLYEDLGLPEILRKMTHQQQGLILVTGTKKSGKTTTLNALVRNINETQNKKIITLEKKIEYKHIARNSIIVQKEVGEGKDCLTYKDGIKNALQEDCDVLVIGEIRDRETMWAALEMAETGHLVIASLHTNSCAETIEKIINFYDAKDRAQIKYLLSTLLKLIISQKLIVGTSGKLELIPEVMVVDKKIAEIIKKEKNSVIEIENAIQSAQDNGSISLINSIARLFVENKITLKQAKSQIEETKRNTLNNTIMKIRIKSK